MSIEIPEDHPRAASLRTREQLIHSWKRNVVADAGLIAHGRGEAFDYLIGEETMPPAEEATKAAAVRLLLAKKPVISVNGNAAALVPKDLVALAKTTGADLEVNLFYRSGDRLKAIGSVLRSAGAKRVLGLTERRDYATVPELSSMRRIVDPSGILVADVVLVPLEDGDRVQALAKMGKVTIAIDLNPLSRTSQTATITIVDNLIRAVPNLVAAANELKGLPRSRLEAMADAYDNDAVLRRSIKFIEQRLSRLARTSRSPSLPRKEDRGR